MKNMNFGALLMLLCVTAAASAEIHRQDLNGDWKFKSAKKSAWHDAKVPGVVHTDLLRHNMIPDPFVGENERQVQWVDKEDWIYETVFDTDSTVFSQENVTLVLEGLDTYADVYLNDSLILKADNMFRQWDIPVKNILRNNDNRLKVYFHSPIKVDMPKFDALPFRYDAINDQSENGGILDKKLSVFARKAGYHYGWDWGPRLVTSGIWRPVYLKAWSGPAINDVFISTRELNKNKAFLAAKIEIFSECDRNAKVDIVDLKENRKLLTRQVSLKTGINVFECPFEIKNPKLWWCNGLGEPNLYDFSVELSLDGKKADTRHQKTGIRQIEVVREKDKDGRSFHFRLNGVPIFVKGANYIPNDNFLPRVTEEIYRRTVQDAADANMNMLRVWGGGIYENDIFYNLCDSLGIMVWQDFMFACSLYPSEGEMLKNIESEARENVRRLRNHPSIALWCGNNECLEAWYTWGLKQRYENEGYADVIWKQYENLFHNLLPRVVKEEAPLAFYWPSSPFSRVEGASENNMGDTHLWTVWGNNAPIDTYNRVTSRFFSEYGFQSFPEYSTVLKFAPDTEQHFIDSDVMLSHQRAVPDANRRIERYLLQDYSQPKDFRSFLYLSQVLQGEAVKTAIEAHRRNRPYCMGTMFWQHNDCWPAASWSSRDYYGNWKAAHYKSREAYRDILLSAIENDGNLNVHIVSDRLKNTDGRLTFSLFSVGGNEISRIDYSLSIPAYDSEVISIPLEEIKGNLNPGDLIAHFSFTDGKSDVTYETVHLFVSPKDLNLQSPDISVSMLRQGEERILSLKSDKFIKALYLSLDEDCFFSDNYFDMIPGKEYRVSLNTNLTDEEILNNLQMTHVFEASLKD